MANYIPPFRLFVHVDRVQPWLDFANLVPFDAYLDPPESASDQLMSDVFDAGAIPKEEGGFAKLKGFPASLVLPPLTSSNRAHLERQHYALFYAVRRAFVEVTDKYAEMCANGRGSRVASSFKPVALQAVGSTFLDIGATGRIRARQDLALQVFIECLEGVEVERIRRCPECGCFYYANRKNKRACDRHLNLMRVNRSRGKRGRFEERQYRQRTGYKRLSRKESKQALELSRALSLLHDQSNSNNSEKNE